MDALTHRYISQGCSVVALVTDSPEQTQPLSRVALRSLSEAMNDVTLTGWRRIQLMAKERTSVNIGVS